MKAGTILFCTLLTAWCALIGSAAVTPKSEIRNPKSTEAGDFFETHVRPVLAENCFSCHGPERQMAGLRLDSRAGLLKGSQHGPVLVAGDPEKSTLIRAIRYRGEALLAAELDHRQPQQRAAPQRSLQRREQTGRAVDALRIGPL